MPRAIVYEPPAVQAHYAKLARKAETPALRRTKSNRALLAEARAKAESGEAPPVDPTKDGTQTGRDAYLEKIAKYVPAEVVTLTTLAVAAFQPGGGTIWWIVLAGAVANVLYLFGTALAATDSPLPRLYFYPLSIIAYGLWAAAIIPAFGDKVGIGGDNVEAEQTFALALAAFLVPLVDSILTNLPTRLKAQQPEDGAAEQPEPAQT
jgi:hypothetical protein